jgi:DNA-binding Xre family transcriptional regulator
MKVVNSQLKLLVAAREMRERRKLGIRTITEESGASRSTVERLLSDTMKRVPLDDLAALCTYFNCEVGDILRAKDVSTNGASNGR